jgi:GLPGLI family protein
MMKVLFINFSLLFVTINSQIKVVYNVSYRPDSTSTEKNIELLALENNNNNSYFFNITKYQLDSLYNKLTIEYERTGLISSSKMRCNLNFGIFKDFNRNKMKEIQEISSKSFIFEVPYVNFDWTLFNEQKQILNYNCKKATCKFGGRKWIAWYTNEIPLQDGPYKFHGLPGLILEIYDDKEDYVLSAFGISKIDKKISLPHNTISISKEKFENLKQKIILDPAIFSRESYLSMKNNGFTVIMKGTDGNIMSERELYERIIKEFNFFKSENKESCISILDVIFMWGGNPA